MTGPSGQRLLELAVAVETPGGAFEFDFLIIGTGFTVDLSLRPELAVLAPDIATWADLDPLDPLDPSAFLAPSTA